MQMFIPVAVLEQTFTRSSPEVIKCAEQCYIYMIYRDATHLCLLCLSWKGVNSAQISLDTVKV